MALRRACVYVYLRQRICVLVQGLFCFILTYARLFHVKHNQAWDCFLRGAAACLCASLLRAAFSSDAPFRFATGFLFCLANSNGLGSGLVGIAPAAWACSMRKNSWCAISQVMPVRCISWESNVKIGSSLVLIGRTPADLSCSATMVPRPWRVVINPSASSARYALATVLKFTRNCLANSLTVGSGCPADRAPLRINSRRASRICSVNPFFR